MFWEFIRDKLAFTGVSEIVVWQDVFLGVLLIPFAIEFLRRLLEYLDSKRPLRLLLKGFLPNDKRILIFLSQLSAIDNSGELVLDQKYIVREPKPLPTAKNFVIHSARQNIDPVWSEGDGECLAGVYNTFGRAGKIQGLKIADSISDWGKWSIPTISIGFCPKSRKLMEKCAPIYFRLDETNFTLSIDNPGGPSLDCYLPNDAGIIQKTSIKGSSTPVILLAGLGTMGTAVAGYCLSKYGEELGKIYGDTAFCALISAKTDEGVESANIKGLFPRPSWDRVIFHYPTYFKLNKSKVFPEIS